MQLPFLKVFFPEFQSDGFALIEKRLSRFHGVFIARHNSAIFQNVLVKNL